MWQNIFEKLDLVDNFLWAYVGFPAIFFVGLLLTLRSGVVQIRKFPRVIQIFWGFLQQKETCENSRGVPPLKAFFACIGGCVGIGNIVAITTAIQIGGPGALLWVWVTAVAGCLVKYGEVYLGIRYRVPYGTDGFRGGPMYFLPKAFKASWPAMLFCVLMSMYGIEIYQFSVVTASVSENFSLYKPAVAAVLLLLVVFAESGGLKRVGNICAAVIPLFISIYLGMGMYVLICCSDSIPLVIADIFHYAFTAHAGIGGFVGSSLLITISQGLRRGCYSSDIGIGYASIIHSESQVKNPAKQASLVIFEVFLDTFVICTMSVLLVLVTGTWQEGHDSMYLVQVALGHYFPYMNFFMPFFLFLLGYSTIITYFFVGMKTVEYLSPKWGRKVYYPLAILAFFTFSFFQASQAILVMSVVQAVLLALIIIAVWRLRKEIRFDFYREPKEVLLPTAAAE